MCAVEAPSCRLRPTQASVRDRTAVPPAHRIRAAAFLLLAASLSALPAGAKPQAQAPDVPRCEALPGLPPDAELEARGARIGEIRYRLSDIFDPSIPEENRRLFRLANRLHRVTRPHTVAEQLTFREGDVYQRRRLDESERVLRVNRYFYDVAICPVAYDGERVAVEVRTRDVWTLRVGASFARAGGSNRTKLQIIEDNVLGSGTSVAIERTSNVDRTTSLLRYTDAHVGGSRVYLDGEYSKNSDGREIVGILERPFFELDARWAAGGSWQDDDRVESIYDLGHIRQRFQHQERVGQVYGGWSRGLVDGWTRRFTFGVASEEHDYGRFRPTDPAPPAGRKLVYPWLGFELVEDDFAHASNFNQMHRVEDLRLGVHGSARLGYALPGLGSDRRAFVYRLGFERGFALPARTTLLLTASTLGRVESPGGWRGALTLGDVHYYRRDFGDQLFLARLQIGFAHRLDPETQLLLGGDSGLRGYPQRYQEGDRSALLQLEQRWFWNWYPFRLLHVGAAGFVDVGRCWFGGDPRSGNERGWLADAGVGLRFAPSRTGLGNVVHVDLALPLVRGRDIHSVEVVVSTQATF